MKQVRETKEGKAISAYVILHKEKLIATIQVKQLKSGVRVDIYDKERLKYMKKGDSLNSALHGAFIDHVQLFDDETPARELKGRLIAFNKARRQKQIANLISERIESGQGAYFTNFTRKRAGDIFYRAGLDRLRSVGYTVIKAI